MEGVVVEFITPTMRVIRAGHSPMMRIDEQVTVATAFINGVTAPIQHMIVCEGVKILMTTVHTPIPPLENSLMWTTRSGRAIERHGTRNDRSA
jgi:hypothetical protein